jgi:hypothetical protein
MPANHHQWPKEQRLLANALVAKALKSGELIRQPCRVCSAPYVLAHHEDYNEPLAVVWLCRSHHVKRHRELDPLIEIRRRQATARTLAKRKAWHAALDQRYKVQAKATSKAELVQMSPSMTCERPEITAIAERFLTKVRRGPECSRMRTASAKTPLLE